MDSMTPGRRDVPDRRNQRNCLPEQISGVRDVRPYRHAEIGSRLTPAVTEVADTNTVPCVFTGS